MPSIELKISELEQLIGKKLGYEELQYDLQWISLDIDDYNKEEETIKVEFNPNRPDFSSPEGIARSLKGYYDLELGLPKFSVKPGKEVFHVDKSVRKVRPYVLSGLVRFQAPLSEEKVITLMHMQEILHWAIGRDREKVAIGIHDYEAVKGPYKYTTVKPDGVKFKPLHLEAYELTPQEILEEHPMGIEYAHLLEGYNEYPIIYDAEGKVVSLPPIINGTYTTVTPDKTKILFLDLTGTNLAAVRDALNVLATTFADMGGQVETVEVIYEDDQDHPIHSPDLSPSKWKVECDYINEYIGLNLSTEEMISCFKKVRFDATTSEKDENLLHVLVPAYRNDIMHKVDFVEEVAMGYGYQNLPKPTKMKGFGKYHPIQKLADQTRLIMVGAGGLEMVNNILVSRKDLQRLNLNFEEKENVVLKNPVSEEYDIARRWLLISLLKNLENNRSAEKPFRLFEVGDTIIIDSSRETNTRRELHLACIVHSDNSDYSEIKSLLDHYLKTLGVQEQVTIKADSHPSFIPGRTGSIIYKSEIIGWIGEVFPQVILNYGLNYPTAAFEIKITRFTDLFE